MNPRSAAPDEPFDVGDRVRIHIPDEDDYDHDKHNKVGRVDDIHVDDASQLPGARHELDDYKYDVELHNEGRFPARHSDLRPIK